MDKLSAMRTFVRIVDTGSLTAAANALDTSLPTVVRTLAALEHQLGVTLLNRTTRRIRLSEEGAHYFEHCRLILSAMQETEESLTARRSEPRGKLTVTASTLFGRRYVAPIINKFVERHANVSAELLLLDRLVNMVEEGVDVAVRIANLRDSSLVAVPVGRVRRVVGASEQYLRRSASPKAPNDVRRHRWIRHTGLMPRSEAHFRIGQRNAAVPISSAFTCNDIETALNACVNGLGLCAFLSYMAAPLVKSGQLKYVLEEFEPAPIAVQVVYPQSKLISNKIRAFVDDSVDGLKKVQFD